MKEGGKEVGAVEGVGGDKLGIMKSEREINLLE